MIFMRARVVDKGGVQMEKRGVLLDNRPASVPKLERSHSFWDFIQTRENKKRALLIMSVPDDLYRVRNFKEGYFRFRARADCREVDLPTILPICVCLNFECSHFHFCK